MNIVWDNHPVTAPEVFSRLNGERGWSQRTVNTFLARLTDKGALAVAKRYNMNFYSPLVTREESLAKESGSFLAKYFNGAASALMAHFCEHGKLSDADLSELESLIVTMRTHQRKKKG